MFPCKPHRRRMNNVDHRDSNLHPTRQEALPEHYAADAGPLPGRSYAADKPHASYLSWHVTSWHYRLPPTPTPHSLLLFWLHWSYNLSPCFARYCDTCSHHALQGRWCTGYESPGRVEMVGQCHVVQGWGGPTVWWSGRLVKGAMGYLTGLVRRSRQCHVLSEGCYN
jgi:hypothetical protein